MRCLLYVPDQLSGQLHQITAGERLDGRTEKMPVKFTIDLLECIYCGYCVEACPLDAIRMDTGIFSVTGNQRILRARISRVAGNKRGICRGRLQKGGEYSHDCRTSFQSDLQSWRCSAPWDWSSFATP
jgi:formate hydrogenlyase subunit 6/NADH:ubiquinone oxidoreductase subunit I